MSSITFLKLRQIQTWHQEKLGDAAAIKEDEPLINIINQYLNSGDPQLRDELIRWMKVHLNSFDYSNIQLYDKSVDIKISFPENKRISDSSINGKIREVLADKEIMMTDLRGSSGNDSSYMDIIIPLQFRNGSYPELIGVLVLRVDPSKILFPVIKLWPVPSRTSETLILRRDGDSVLYLNTLRYRENHGLRFRLSMKNENLLAVKAVLGAEGYVEGIDYRNIPVVGYLARVPGFPWFMVTKTDKSELTEPLSRYLNNAILIGILLLLINVTLFGIWIWNKRLKLFRGQLNIEKRFRDTLDNMIEGCQIIGSDWKYLYLNDAADVHNRRPKEELLGEYYTDKWPGIKDTEVYRRIEDCLVNRVYTQMENQFIFPDGATAWFDLRIQPVPEGVFILSIDITERKKISQKLVESESLFRSLFENMLNGFAYCKMIYEPGKLPDFVYLNVNKSFEQLTFLKNVEGRRASEVIPGIQTTDRELLERYARVSTTGKPEVFEIWVEALKMWFLISVYSPGKDYFVCVFDVITERKQTEASLKESEARFRSLYENMTIGMYRTTIDGRILLANPALVKMLGFDSFEQLVDRNLEQEGYEPDYPRSNFLEKMELYGKITGLESVWNQKNGSALYVRENATAIRDSDQKILYYDGTVEDITEQKLAEEALKESEDQFRYIFDHSMMGQSITFPSGELQVNDAFCSILGYSADELNNLKWQDFTHPDDFELTENIIKSHLAGEKESSRFIKRYIKKDGSTVWADVSTSLRHDKSGKALYFMTTINDITDLKLAEEILRNDEKRLRDILESLPQLFWTCRFDGPCDYLSRQWIDYTGIPESEQLGYGWLEQLHPDDREKTISDWSEKVKTGDIFDIEFRIRRKDGEYHWFKTRAVPMRSQDCKIIKWLGSNTDIDSIRKAEEQLINYSKNLEESVIQRTNQLESANKELEAFSYSVSHDLRAPLRSVHGFTKILLENYFENLDEEGKRICTIISSSASQMSELIDDLLNFSRIGRSTMKMSLLNMHELVSPISSELLAQQNNSSIKLVIGKLYKVRGDLALMKHVWYNLISNAIKYSSKENFPEILISSWKEKNMIIYAVKDNGVGFDMQYSNKLFGVFQRLHSETEFEGNGVGLAIVQRIVKRHGGMVWAEAETGKGATFYFSLPVIGIEIMGIENFGDNVRNN